MSDVTMTEETVEGGQSQKKKEISTKKISSLPKSFSIEDILTSSGNCQTSVAENKEHEPFVMAKTRIASEDYHNKTNTDMTMFRPIDYQNPSSSHFQSSSVPSGISASTSQKTAAFACLNAMNTLLNSSNRNEYESLALPGYSMWQQSLSSVLSASVPALRFISSPSSSLLYSPMLEVRPTPNPGAIHNARMNHFNSCYPTVPRISNASMSTSGQPAILTATDALKNSEVVTMNYCRRRKARTVFSDIQIAELEKTFEKQRYLSTPERIDIATSLGLSESQVKTWFQNRRMKLKKERKLAGTTVSTTAVHSSKNL